MKCDKCGFEGSFIEENFGQYIVVFCPECYFHTTGYCNHETNNIVKYSLNSGWRVQNSCVKCYRLYGSYLKQSLHDLSKIREINKEKHDKYHEEQGNKYADRITVLNERHREWNKNEWLNQHNSYLRSAQWKDKREQVLQRDNYLCQACRDARATEVHHLSYAHWKNEPLFELVSICSDCHKLITKLDNENK